MKEWMMNKELMVDILVGVLVLYCVYTDVKVKKIKNYITFSLMFIGIIYNTLNCGMSGLLLSGQGLILCGLIALVFYMVNGFGMGDVKLFMGIGAIKGFTFTLDVFAFSFFSAGIITLLLKPKKICKAINNICYMLRNIMFFREFDKIPQSESALIVPYAVYIFCGLIVAYLMGGDWLWQLLIK